MKFLLTIGLALTLTTGMLWAQQPPAHPPAPPAPIIKPVAPNLADLFAQAQAETAKRMQELEATAAYQAWLAAKNNEGKALLYVMGKTQADPDLCKPQFDKYGGLTGFECKQEPRQEPKK